MGDETKSIGLIGFMATGKSTVGMRLGKMLGREFIDTDMTIEKTTGMTISEIFSERGESQFRALESEVVKEVCSRKSVVISFGGGAPLNHSNAALIRESSIVVLLQASVETLVSRIERNELRPLLVGISTNLRERVTEMLETRRAVYEDLAHLVVDTDGKSTTQTAREVLERLNL
ncbi:MAG: shikimate kinase [Promethearchaeota archaeon]